MVSSEVRQEEFKFPDCWNDDLRMSALFAPFRSKSLNPTDWDSKMKFWSNLIDRWCKHSKCPVVNTSLLKNNFCRNKLYPTCLDDVVLHLNSNGILIFKDSIQSANQSWKSWAAETLVLKPIKKTFSILKNTIMRPGESETFYVHVPTIKFLGDEIIQVTNSKIGLISFKELLLLGYRHPDDLLLVLQWLQSQGIAAIHTQNEECLVKVSKNGQKPVNITEKDLVMYKLDEKEKILDDSIKNLECEREKALNETKKHLSNKMKNMALISLQRKKKLEKEMEKRAVMLENIREIKHQIDQVELNSEVIDCYQKGVKALKNVLKEKNLSKEVVTETMDELNDILKIGNEIDDALSQPRDPSLDEGLEAELDELLLANAPSVPADDLPVDSSPKEAKPKKEESLETRMEALAI